LIPAEEAAQATDSVQSEEIAESAAQKE